MTLAPQLAVALVVAACGGSEGRSASEIDASASRDGSAVLDVADETDAAPVDAWIPSRDGSVRPDAGIGDDAGAPDAGPGLGAENGEACTVADDCRWAEAASEHVPACLPGDRPGDWPNPAGWTGGYCASACARPPAIETGVALEQRECPSGSLCTPMSAEPGDAYDFGICLRACETDADCRADEGYFCRRDWGLSVETPNGVCMGWH